MDRSALTPLYARYLVRLIRPFPNWDFFFIKPLRQRAVLALQLKKGSRVLDGGCGPGGTFPYLVDAVGSAGEVVGVEISPEIATNARRRIEANRWDNVEVVVGDARAVKLIGRFDGLVLFAAPDLYASPDAVSNLLQYLKHDGRVVVFGAKLSRHAMGAVLNFALESLMKLSFSSTPRLTHEPWNILKDRLSDIQVKEYFFGGMFLACGSIRDP
jgi:SAM-dependent methyltransferase